MNDELVRRLDALVSEGMDKIEAWGLKRRWRGLGSVSPQGWRGGALPDWTDPELFDATRAAEILAAIEVAIAEYRQLRAALDVREVLNTDALLCFADDVAEALRASLGPRPLARVLAFPEPPPFFTDDAEWTNAVARDGVDLHPNDDYFGSDHWKQFRGELTGRCALCGRTAQPKLAGTSDTPERFMTTFHHLNYDHLGAEIVGRDVIELCWPCHRRHHGIEYKRAA